MKELQKTKFTSLLLNEEYKYLVQSWRNLNEAMNEEDYKENMLLYRDEVENCKIEKALIDTRQINFTVTVNLQKWVDSEIAKFTTKYIKYIAFVMPENLVQQISIEQTMDEKEGRKVTTRYFDYIQKAEDWLHAL